MRNGNPLIGLRIVQDQEGRAPHAQQGINQTNVQRIRINPQRQINNLQNDVVREENEGERGDQGSQNHNNDDNQMDLI